jgi:dihydroflavonol-4-reductase
VRALVLGATGHIGSAVARELIVRGHLVTAAGRRSAPPANLAGLALTYTPGDSDRPEQLEAWIPGHDTVIDAAAPYPSMLVERKRDAVDPIDYAAQRTATLIAAVRRPGARLAYVSSFTTLPDRRGGLAQWQGEMIRRVHPYFAVKQLIEAEVIAAARTGMPTVIVNPTLCVGPWDMKPRELCFVPRLLGGEAPAAMGHVLNVIDVRDVAAAIVAALEAERYGEPIALTGHNISNEALYRWICDLGGVRPPRFIAPAVISVVAAWCGELAATAAGMRPPIPALAAMLTMLHDSFDLSAAQRDLGVTPRPLSATLVDTIDWYRQIGYC